MPSNTLLSVISDTGSDSSGDSMCHLISFHCVYSLLSKWQCMWNDLLYWLLLLGGGLLPLVWPPTRKGLCSNKAFIGTI